MTYHSDPTRWSQLTSSDGDTTPELLRGAFHAGTREGPSDLQMRTLALKLAAVGTGAALAAGASTAHASTTAAGQAAAGGAFGALKTSGALTFSKIAVSIALVGAAATGVVYMQRGSAPQAQRDSQVQAALPAHQLTPAPAVAAVPSAPVPSAPVENLRAPVGAPVGAPVVTKNTAVAVAALDQPSQRQPAQVRDQAPAADSVQPSAGKSHHNARAERRSSTHESATVAASAQPTLPNDSNKASKDQAQRPSAERAAGQRQQLSEIELLRTARAALAARPREAYRLAEEHKALYPQGVFAQERDALAVEAMQRAGDLKLARKLAEAFVRSYPSSPHAHRFVETMNLK